MSQDQDVLIGKFQKNAEQIVKVMRRRYRGVDLVDTRVFFKEVDANHGDVWSPSKAGVALQLHQVPELIGLLKRAIGDKVEEGEAEGDAEA